MVTTPRKGKRILIIVENLPVPFDRRVWQEAVSLKEAGYQVSIICPKGKGHQTSKEIINGILIYRHPVLLEANGAIGYFVEYSIALLFEFFLTLRVFLHPGFDAIHACNPPDNIFLIGLFFKLFKKKFVFDHHDINPELYEAKFRRKDFFYKLMILSERWSFKTADISIATNESYKKIAIERGGMDPNKVFVVRSGPRLEHFPVLPPVPAHKNGRQYLVGYVGVIGKQEGIDYLLEAVRYLTNDRERRDIHFKIIGGGAELENMKALARNLKIADYVTFTGRIPDQELLEILNTADVCVNPDEANEMNDKSTMNKIMEYMALGKPIVQFDLKEGRYSAGDASLYALKNDATDFAEKIAALLDNAKLREQMGRSGRKRLQEQLAWEYQVPQLLTAYKTLFE